MGLLAVAYVAELATASVPMLVLVQNGVGSRGVLTPVISLLIILGSDFHSGQYDFRYRYPLCQRGGAPYGFSGEEAKRSSAQKRGIYADFCLYRLWHRSVWSDGGGQQGICISGICGSYYTFYSVCDSCYRDKRERYLRKIFQALLKGSAFFVASQHLQIVQVFPRSVQISDKIE